MGYVVLVYDGDDECGMNEEDVFMFVERREVDEFLETVDPSGFYDGINKIAVYKLCEVYKSKVVFEKEC